MDLIKRFFSNLSIKYKILILFCLVTTIIATLLGLYSLNISKKNIINKVSALNISVNNQLNSQVNFLLRDITDISTNICIDKNVQSLLSDQTGSMQTRQDLFLTANSSLSFVTNIIASKSYISFFVLYSKLDDPVYYEFTDMSIGAKGFRQIQESGLYQSALAQYGSPLSFHLPKGENVFIQRSTYAKVGICRIVKNFTSNEPIGFLVIGFNESTLRSLCQSNLKEEDEAITVLDETGAVVSQAGTVFSANSDQAQAFYQSVLDEREGYAIKSIGNADYLISYATMSNGWKSFYAVPMVSLIKEINSINSFTIVLVLACLALSVPLITLILNYLASPLTALLKSMKRFQQGNFNESVAFRYNDEIGQLADGYNNMVKNIKQLIDQVYVLQIREREAELNALQAQINPHFLYNTLDAIFWKAQLNNEQEISEMVCSLSRLFRLSLNRGERLTSVANEAEMLSHYLLLQKMRMKEKLQYSIQINDDIMNCMIPKLMLQPFVENAILHGLDGKEEGGCVCVTGGFEADHIKFVIRDDGIGMNTETMNRLFDSEAWKTATGNAGTSAYAVGNVNERLKIMFKDQYDLNIESEVNIGTTITLRIPLAPIAESKEVSHDSTIDRG